MDPTTLALIVAAGVGAMVLVVLVSRIVSRAQTPAPSPQQEQTVPRSTPDLNLQEASGSERRNAPRRKGSAISVLITDEQHPEPHTSWIVDRSTTGLCLELDEPREQGIIVQLKPAEAPQATAWVPAEVKYCRKAGAVYHIGCHFVRTPPWNVLLLFG